jgi:hypothetical protein
MAGALAAGMDLALLFVLGFGSSLLCWVWIYDTGRGGFVRDEEFGAPRQIISRQSFGAEDLENALISEGESYNANFCLLFLRKRRSLIEGKAEPFVDSLSVTHQPTSYVAQLREGTRRSVVRALTGGITGTIALIVRGLSVI